MKGNLHKVGKEDEIWGLSWDNLKKKMIGETFLMFTAAIS
jgi:hypothetical protein